MLTAVVEITVRRRLKPTESRKLLNEEVTENPVLTDCFIVFYRSFED